MRVLIPIRNQHIGERELEKKLKEKKLKVKVVRLKGELLGYSTSAIIEKIRDSKVVFRLAANFWLCFHCVFHLGNSPLFAFMISTSDSMTGTSTSTPTTVASAAPEFMPNNINATAIESSKKLLAPIIVAGAASV